MDKREQSLDVLQDRVTELKERAKLQEIPLQMQVRRVGREMRNIIRFLSVAV